MTSLLWDAYRWIAEVAHLRDVRPLGRKVRYELAGLATLAPMMQSQSWPKVSPVWY